MSVNNTKLTNNQIKALFNLYNYGFTVEEIAMMLNGKEIFDTINEKIETILENILDYAEDLYYTNHICRNVDIERELKNGTIEENIINSLYKLQEKITKDIDNSIIDVFKREIEFVIKIIHNIENVQQEYSELIKGTFNVDIIRTMGIVNNMKYTGKIKNSKLNPVKNEPIITEEQWQKTNEILNHYKVN